MKELKKDEVLHSDQLPQTENFDKAEKEEYEKTLQNKDKTELKTAHDGV